MRFISTKTHGVLDYVVGAVLIVAPWLLGFSDVAHARNCAVAIGVLNLLYSVFTSYELGLAKVIPMRGHLWLDALSGLFLAASPWLLHYADQVYVPHLLVGLFEVVAALCTKTVPYTTVGRPSTGTPAAAR